MFLCSPVLMIARRVENSFIIGNVSSVAFGKCFVLDLVKIVFIFSSHIWAKIFWFYSILSDLQYGLLFTALGGMAIFFYLLHEKSSLAMPRNTIITQSSKANIDIVYHVLRWLDLFYNEPEHLLKCAFPNRTNLTTRDMPMR
jgi:hypothetical protein